MGFRVSGFGFRVPGSGVLEFQVSGFGCWMSASGVEGWGVVYGFAPSRGEEQIQQACLLKLAETADADLAQGIGPRVLAVWI
jgi:hypothetical protein